MKRKPTRRWAFGNKRQKKKVAAFGRPLCSCWHCWRPDRRQAILEKLARSES